MTDRHISVDANIVVLNASQKYSTYFYFYTSPEVSMSFSFFHCSCQICVCSGTLSGQAVKSYQSIIVKITSMYIHHRTINEVLYLSSLIFHEEKKKKKPRLRKKKLKDKNSNKKNYSIKCHFILLLFVYVREKCKFYDSTDIIPIKCNIFFTVWRRILSKAGKDYL